MGLNAKQKEAVEYLDGPLLVLAGPGTGKTHLLSEKVAYILKNVDINPENILCLTFTDSGAMNMRTRLAKTIGAASQKVHISTYHSFGTDLLAEYKNYAEDYDLSLDSAIDEVTQFKIVKNIQASLPGRDILRADNVKDIISVISSAKSAGLTAKDLAKIAEQNIEDSKVLSQAISPLLKNVVPRVYQASYDNAYAPIYEILKSYTELKPITKNIERSIGALARDLKAAIIEAESTEKISPLSHWKDTYFEKDEAGNYRLKDRIANKKLQSIAGIMATYNEYLRKNGLYDFDDMIEKSAEILKTDAGFRATLEERYQYICLDEFQDTNPSQFNIIKQLTAYEKPVIMAVGDDDQAIYEFQGALASNLTDFQEHYDAHVISLVENYRSTQEILDFSREVIAQAPDRFADKELISHAPAPKKSQIYRHEFLSSDMEYTFIAKEIKKLVNSGIPQKEIAIISYKTKYFLPLLPYLKSEPGLNIAYEKRDNLLENEAMHQIFTICRYVYELAHERNENTNIVEILSYPFWHLPMLDVVNLIAEARNSKRSVFAHLSASQNSAITEVAGFIANLVAKSLTEPLEIFLDYLIGSIELENYRSPFLAYHTQKSDYDTLTLYENLASLRGKLHRHFPEQKLTLKELVEMLDDYGTAEMPINTTSPYKDADDAIQVLSAHKAKGLEFKYVFIIAADHSAWGKGKGNNNLLALPKNLATIRHTGTTDGEKLRILYVALTRAKDALYITNSLKDFNGKSPERLEYLCEHEDAGVVYSEFLPAKTVTTHYEANLVDAKTLGLKNWLTPYVHLAPDLTTVYKNRLENHRISATSLTSFIDIVYGGPQEFFKTYVLKAPMGPETESLAFGNLIHQTFEAVTNKNLTDDAALQFFLEKLDASSLDSDTKKALLDKGPADLAISLKAFSKILHQGRAEVNLSPEKPSIDGIPLTGKIDHIIIDEADKSIEIYDFKTANYHKENWRSHATLYKYMLQLGFYKLLLNNSPTYAKYKVKKAHILFVTPNSDGEVYDKVYEYNPKDEVELKHLISAVYHSVTSLDFLTDPELFIAPDSTKSLKDIKNFIALLLAKYPKN